MSTHFFYLPGRLARHSVLFIYIYDTLFFKVAAIFFQIEKTPPGKAGFILLANRVEIGHNNKDNHGDKK